MSRKLPGSYRIGVDCRTNRFRACEVGYIWLMTVVWRVTMSPIVTIARVTFPLPFLAFNSSQNTHQFP